MQYSLSDTVDSIRDAAYLKKHSQILQYLKMSQ